MLRNLLVPSRTKYKLVEISLPGYDLLALEICSLPIYESTPGPVALAAAADQLIQSSRVGSVEQDQSITIGGIWPSGEVVSRTATGRQILRRDHREE
jgi:hypothetical protein